MTPKQIGRMRRRSIGFGGWMSRGTGSSESDLSVSASFRPCSVAMSKCVFMPGIMAGEGKTATWNALRVVLDRDRGRRGLALAPFERRHFGDAAEFAVEIGLGLETHLEHDLRHGLVRLGKQRAGL